MFALETDEESAAWLRELGGPGREAAVARLHDLLLRVARADAARRRPRLPDRLVEELDDLCVQAANDAVLLILRKLDTFHGRARFTTWACKFVILEFSTRVRRLVWRARAIEPDPAIWDRLADHTPPVLQVVEDRQLLQALQRAVRDHLTERQRAIFQAALIDEIPIDVLADRMGTTRGAIYKTLHDSRRKLRDVLADAGYGSV
jgi:RNA polymerase sigma-70 factor (ECF subfamily)